MFIIDLAKEITKELTRYAINELKTRWQKYHHDAYLKKMGWSEDEFERHNDPDIDKYADRIVDFYQGYQYIHVFESARNDPFTRYNTWSTACDAMCMWCQENCQDKWREDIHFVHEQTSIDPMGLEKTDWWKREWWMNEIGGREVLFFAFKSSQDYTLFCLKWS